MKELILVLLTASALDELAAATDGNLLKPKVLINFSGFCFGLFRIAKFSKVVFRVAIRLE